MPAPAALLPAFEAAVTRVFGQEATPEALRTRLVGEVCTLCHCSNPPPSCLEGAWESSL